MIQRLLFFIAGVDRKTMLDCPATDRMWASHIGFSLCLSFSVVLGISYLATGYIVDIVWLRGAIAFVIATTVFMFDRALFQSDWFVQGAFYVDEEGQVAQSGNFRRLAGRFVRVAVRLTMSLGLAWVIALFLELALFSDTISDKIERDRIANNRPAFEQIAQFEVDLDRQIAARAASLQNLENSMLEALSFTPERSFTQSTEIDQRARLISERQAAILRSIHEIDTSIQRHLTDMNAEELGQKLNPLNTGRTGQGPRYEFAKREKENLENLLQSRRNELAQIAAEQEVVQKARSEQIAAATKLDDENRAALESKRATLRSQVDAARADLGKMESAKNVQLADFRRSVMERLHVQAKRDAADPLTRIAAYQDLKADPKDGRIMSLFSWMTRLFIIFLEIVPVVAKIFFSPPSVYALKIKAEIDRARQDVRDRMKLHKMTTQPQPVVPITAALNHFEECLEHPTQFDASAISPSASDDLAPVERLDRSSPHRWTDRVRRTLTRKGTTKTPAVADILDSLTNVNAEASMLTPSSDALPPANSSPSPARFNLAQAPSAHYQPFRDQARRPEPTMPQFVDGPETSSDLPPSEPKSDMNALLGPSVASRIVGANGDPQSSAPVADNDPVVHQFTSSRFRDEADQTDLTPSPITYNAANFRVIL
jgi:hypothetical protein